MRRPFMRMSSTRPRVRALQSFRGQLSAIEGLKPGVVVSGRYRVSRKVATGGMGEVWVGEHSAVELRVALKVLLPESRRSPEIEARFGREAQLLSRIRSDHVARVIDFVSDSRFGSILVTEFIEGRQLLAALGSARLSVEQAIELGIELCEALREIHSMRVVHRDLKPGNVILQPTAGGRTRAVIVDFGVSCIVADDIAREEEPLTRITADETVVGTVDYMAPEQILGSHRVGPAADLYALGAILFRAVMGANVFGPMDRIAVAQAKLTRVAPSLVTGRRDVRARGLEAVVARALERAPIDRYASADAFLADLVRLRAPAEAERASVDGARPRRPTRRSATLAFAAAAVGAALFVQPMSGDARARSPIAFARSPSSIEARPAGDEDGGLRDPTTEATPAKSPARSFLAPFEGALTASSPVREEALRRAIEQAVSEGSATTSGPQVAPGQGVESPMTVIQ
jgi:serine/threonine protein kinase